MSFSDELKGTSYAEFSPVAEQIVDLAKQEMKQNMATGKTITYKKRLKRHTAVESEISYILFADKELKPPYLFSCNQDDGQNEMICFCCSQEDLKKLFDVIMQISTREGIWVNMVDKLPGMRGAFHFWVDV